MPDFSSVEQTSAVSPLPENPFAHLPITFLLKPLLITGRAMQYYGLRPDEEAHFLVPKPEFERPWTAIPEGHMLQRFGMKKAFALAPPSFMSNYSGLAIMTWKSRRWRSATILCCTSNFCSISTP